MFLMRTSENLCGGLWPSNTARMDLWGRGNSWAVRPCRSRGPSNPVPTPFTCMIQSFGALTWGPDASCRDLEWILPWRRTPLLFAALPHVWFITRKNFLILLFGRFCWKFFIYSHTHAYLSLPPSLPPRCFFYLKSHPPLSFCSLSCFV